MKRSLLIFICFLAACATPPQDRTPLRLPQTEMAKLSPVSAPSLDELAALARKGESAEAIITRLKAAGTLRDLTPSQAMELHAQGLPLAVLDYLHESWASARQNDRATELNNRDALCRQALEKQKLEIRSELPNCPWPPGWHDPWWPHGMWGGYYWRR